MQRSPNQRIRRVAALALVATLGWTTAGLAQGSVEDIASGMICLCGCNKLLNVCDMDTAKQMKAIIGEKLAEGMGKREVIEFMTATYGEQVLAAPTKKGFNLTAWITPFALLLVGAVSILFLVHAWANERREAVEVELAVARSEDLESKYGSVLERELKEWEI